MRRPSASLMTIFTVKRPLGRPRRSTGAVSREPRTTRTRLPLTETSADAALSPAGTLRRIRNFRARRSAWPRAGHDPREDGSAIAAGLERGAGRSRGHDGMRAGRASRGGCGGGVPPPLGAGVFPPPGGGPPAPENRAKMSEWLLVVRRGYSASQRSPERTTSPKKNAAASTIVSSSIIAPSDATSCT